MITPSEIRKYFREVRREGEKVTWPDRKETVVTTAMVFIVVALISMFLFISDQIIAEIIQFILSFAS